MSTKYINLIWIDLKIKEYCTDGYQIPCHFIVIQEGYPYQLDSTYRGL